MFKIPEQILNQLNNVETSQNLKVLFVLPGIQGNCEQFKDLSDKLLEQNAAKGRQAIEFIIDKMNNITDDAAITVKSKFGNNTEHL